MFAADVEGLLWIYERLNSIRRRAGAAAERLHTAGERLTSLEQTAGAAARLSRAENTLDEQLAVIGQMMRALERIVETYSRCDGIVAQRQEAGGAAPYRFGAWGETDLTPVIRELEDMKLL